LAVSKAELPDGVLVTDSDVVASYRQGQARDPNAGTPLAVVRPRRTEEVQALLRWAIANRAAVVPRSAGTGRSGGATAVDGGIVLSTEKMRDITVDPVTRTAVVQPGLLSAEVKKAVAEYRLWYPPDPASFEICSVGGNVATIARAVLREIRRHRRLCGRSGGGAGRRHGRAAGRPAAKDVAGLSLTKLHGQ
jgi:glycolate oxidase